LEKEHNIVVSWVAFPLHPEIPEEGFSLQDLFRGRNMDIEQMMSYLKRIAKEEGLPFGERTMTYNSRLAQELGKWAESRGKGREFHSAVFRAYFAHGKNIGKKSTLLDLAISTGLAGDEAEMVLTQRTHRNDVDQDWSRSRAMGVTAVPTFLLRGQRIVGAQPYDALAKFIRDRGVIKRSMIG
jgi:predicted DsbA family dithiol-disulfide isomerase